MRTIYIIILLMALIPLSVAASEEKEDNKLCELLAFQFRNAHGGDMIYIQPLQANGAYEEGEYTGHWLNYYYCVNECRNPEMKYYDDTEKTYYRTKEEVLKDYTERTGKKAQLWNINKGEHPPFPLIYNYS